MKRVAVFDFDKTIITKDAEDAYLRFASNIVLFHATVAEGLARYGWLCVRKKQTTSLRTFMKGFVVRRLLGGKKLSDLDEAVRKTFKWQKFNEPVMKALREHHANGDAIVVASGSLSLFLPQLLCDVPHDALICTDIGVENGVVTGELINGNCVRKSKAARVKAWMDEHGPWDESFGYGNYPDDVPMLQLMRHRVIV
jgi:phosphatidylglycerophosphatase C